MNARHWERRLAAFAILVYLAFVVNPELRVLLMLVNSLGLELVILVLATQLRSLLPAIHGAFASASLWTCAISFFILRSILRFLGALMPGRALSVSTLLYVLSKNLWCPISERSAEAPQHT
jgi:hypothetical protein